MWFYERNVKNPWFYGQLFDFSEKAENYEYILKLII
jgi:hypothetical protein